MCKPLCWNAMDFGYLCSQSQEAASFSLCFHCFNQARFYHDWEDRRQVTRARRYSSRILNLIYWRMTSVNFSILLVKSPKQRSYTIVLEDPKELLVFGLAGEAMLRKLSSNTMVSEEASDFIKLSACFRPNVLAVLIRTHIGWSTNANCARQ